jgi:hypothetical protein
LLFPDLILLFGYQFQLFRRETLIIYVVAH